MTKRKALALADVKKELAEVARVGQMFVDGDDCRHLWTPEAQTFLRGDDMNYDNDVAVRVKKTLFRLERLGRVPCSTTLWRRRPDFPGSGEALLFGSSGSPDGADKPSNRGYVPPEMTPEMKKVFLEGKSAWKVRRGHPRAQTLIERGLDQPVCDLQGTATVQLFVPVKDSMGEIAAALEVFTVVTGR